MVGDQDVNADKSGGPEVQRLEQGTHNPLVRGSNPCGPRVALKVGMVGTARGAMCGAPGEGAEWDGGGHWRRADYRVRYTSENTSGKPKDG